MLPIVNSRGYTAADPLDRLSEIQRYLLTALVVAGTTAALLACAELMVEWIDFRSWGHLLILAGSGSLIWSLILIHARKFSSWLIAGLVFVPGVAFDVFVESNLRQQGAGMPWAYPATSTLPVFVQIAVIWLAGAVSAGPLSLWLARTVAHLRVREENAAPSAAQRAALFPPEWTSEPVTAPKRGRIFWFLRLFGLFYLLYLLFILFGRLGQSPWPAWIQQIMSLVYDNPAMAMNTLSKICLTILLAFIAAYNAQVRWYATLALLVTHGLSAICAFGFYQFAEAEVLHQRFFLYSWIIDGVLAAIFVAILFRSRNQAQLFAKEENHPLFYSLPARLNRSFLYVLSVFAVSFIPFAIGWRFWSDGSEGWAAVYGYPDPQLVNTIAKYGTLSVLAFLMAEREKLRDYLFPVLLFGFAVTVILSAPWLLIGDMLGEVSVKTRMGTRTTVDWYFMLHVVVDGAIVLLLIGLRKMYYHVDHLVAALSPSSARCAIALHDAFFDADEDSHANILRRIDRHVSGIRGRRRGLLSFPFWVIEHVFCTVFGLRPAFSSMSREERRFFLQKYLLRSPHEIERALIPPLADIAFKLGTAVHAIINFAHYSSLEGGAEIGYVPPDARDRLQTSSLQYPAPFRRIATLSKTPGPLKDHQPVLPAHVEPRVVTPVSEPEIPAEVDYLVIGSGAGGAVMAYRLASEAASPERILLVERGERYSPLQDFNDDEMEMVRKLYKEGGMQQTKRFDLVVLQGECVGGTTVINNAACVKMPAAIRRQWEEEYDIDLSRLEEEYRRVAKEIEIAEVDELAINQKVKAKFLAAVRHSGFEHGIDLEIEKIQANYRNPLGDGMDNLGNKRLRKRTMLETYLPWAEAHGVTIASGTSAIRVIREAHHPRNAAGVILRTASGSHSRVRVRKAIVVAGGVIASSHFLMRSGVGPNAGTGMSCNFAFPFTYDFDEPLDAFDGVQISMAAFERHNRAAFETYFNPPAAFAIAVPFYFDRHRQIMERYRYLATFGALVGSRSNGSIERKSNFIDGRAFTWDLDHHDVTNIKFAFRTLMQMGLAAGARRVVVPTNPGIHLELSESEVASFVKALEDYPLRMSDLRLLTAHPQGGNRMIGRRSHLKEQRVVDEKFNVVGFDNLFVADASLFPCSLTVNPQWTIMALSSIAATHVLERGE